MLRGRGKGRENNVKYPRTHIHVHTLCHGLKNSHHLLLTHTHTLTQTHTHTHTHTHSLLHHVVVDEAGHDRDGDSAWTVGKHLRHILVL